MNGITTINHTNIKEYLKSINLDVNDNIEKASDICGYLIKWLESLILIYNNNSNTNVGNDEYNDLNESIELKLQDLSYILHCIGIIYLYIEIFDEQLKDGIIKKLKLKNSNEILINKILKLKILDNSKSFFNYYINKIVTLKFNKKSPLLQYLLSIENYYKLFLYCKEEIEWKCQVIHNEILNEIDDNDDDNNNTRNKSIEFFNLKKQNEILFIIQKILKLQNRDIDIAIKRLINLDYIEDNNFLIDFEHIAFIIIYSNSKKNKTKNNNYIPSISSSFLVTTKFNTLIIKLIKIINLEIQNQLKNFTINYKFINAIYELTSLNSNGLYLLWKCFTFNIKFYHNLFKLFLYYLKNVQKIDLTPTIANNNDIKNVNIMRIYEISVCRNLNFHHLTFLIGACLYYESTIINNNHHYQQQQLNFHNELKNLIINEMKDYELYKLLNDRKFLFDYY